LELDDECTALKLPAEIRLASHKLGMLLLKIFQPTCNNEISFKYKEAIHKQKTPDHYSIVFCMYACELKIL